MATTFQELFNNVLINLGEEGISGAVTTLEEQYHLTLRNFINQILFEIQTAHNWGSLRRTCTATVTAGSDSATVQYAAVDISQSSRLARIPDSTSGSYIPLVFNITDPSNPVQMTERELFRIIRLQTLSLQSQADPVDFALDPFGSAMSIRLNPRPSTDQTISLQMIVPQSRFVGNSTDMNSDIRLPPDAVTALEIGSTWYALEERGEELGTNPLFTQARYDNALDSAIAIDDAGSSGDDYEMVVV